jgi:hypothetical protein
VQAVVETATSGRDPRLLDAPAACPGCGRRSRPHEPRRHREVQTQCGFLALPRPW